MPDPLASQKWPRLSQQLTEIRHPEFCQSCGVHEGDSETDLQRWQEHDDADRPEPILVVLCGACADALIEPHPRLYDQLHACAPWLGCMAICALCRFRDGLKCRHPSAKANGGSGIALTMPQPFRAFVDGRGGPKVEGGAVGWSRSIAALCRPARAGRRCPSLAWGGRRKSNQPSLMLRRQPERDTESESDTCGGR